MRSIAVVILALACMPAFAKTSDHQQSQDVEWYMCTNGTCGSAQNKAEAEAQEARAYAAQREERSLAHEESLAASLAEPIAFEPGGVC
jgi:hypothetical protein